jgi:hypothetical protein
MKGTARIVKFKGKEMKSAADLKAALEALMADLVSGAVKPGEAKKIQKEIDARLRARRGALETDQQWTPSTNSDHRTPVHRAY